MPHLQAAFIYRADFFLDFCNNRIKKVQNALEQADEIAQENQKKKKN